MAEGPFHDGTPKGKHCTLGFALLIDRDPSLAAQLFVSVYEARSMLLSGIWAQSGFIADAQMEGSDASSLESMLRLAVRQLERTQKDHDAMRSGLLASRNIEALAIIAKHQADDADAGNDLASHDLHEFVAALDKPTAAAVLAKIKQKENCL